ncbi:MAG: aminotransferase class V-fold PLP-dependent enzyme [Myxococcota bacterium]|nr:aminotransferase class V-fold PLP-dependent enzyme [Myxococcota bacterium]
MIAIDPRALRAHYGAFLREGRVLLTGHSHQAWPDVARDGQLRAWDDAAELADDKWERAFEAAEAVRGAIAARIGAAPDEIALGASTHELVARFLSALDLRARPHLVTTSGEFHSMHRQLMRLAEEGARIEIVPWAPVDTLAERLAAAFRDDTAALLASTVLFETASIVPGLRVAIEAAQRRGAAVLLDAYHAFGALPFSLAELGPEPIFVTAGGYKYAQWGEGNCFLRVPPGCTMRPVYTGWFSDFANLATMRGARAVGYGARGAERFAGSTYDPTSHYRARAVIDFFGAHDLTIDRLRALSLAQTGRIIAGLEGIDVITPRQDDARAGFVAMRVEDASGVVGALRARGIVTDARGDVLRLGPAPYVTDDELDAAVSHVRDLVIGR